MSKINKDYIYMEEWDDINNIKLEENALYIYAHDPEERSFICANTLKKHNKNTSFIEVDLNEDNDNITIVGQKNNKISLYSNTQIGSLLSPYSVIYLEVTGMSCRVAAPLLKYAMGKNMEMRVIYAEPSNYKIEEFRKMGMHKDLCETVKGIYPLPGFANLLPHQESPLFVVLLGFEGGRFSHIVQDQSPENEKITPVLGVPGYKINYPYVSIWGNRNQLINTGSWQKLKYAEANSIVDIYFVLKQLSYENRNPEMVIAPIGTKPHAIGAILYSIKNPNKVEIVYDNPTRKVNRTDGIGKVLVCNVTNLYKEN